MRRSTVLVAIVCLALGAVAQRFYDLRRLRIAPPPAVAVQPSLPRPAAEEQPVTTARFDLEPLWAYGFDSPAKSGDRAAPQPLPSRALRPGQDPEEQTKPRHVDGSSASYSLVDIRDGQNIVDWFPGDHAPMPDVIAHGPVRADKAKRGCGLCHLPNGKGRPENAPVSSLPTTYFIRQLQDFRSGLRRSADPRKPNTNTMIDLARAMTDQEIQAAATYFGSIRWTPWIRVVETNLVPKTKIVGNLFLPVESARTEPIAGRIIEVPEDVEQADTLRNPHSGFVAYAPMGSITKGKDLVVTGGMKVVGNTIVQGRTTPCGTCHGLDLMGVADVPPIAGRSPSYLIRQMWDMQQGTRNGASAQLMKIVVANLTGDDLVAIAAYVSSRTASAASSGQLASK